MTPLGLALYRAGSHALSPFAHTWLQHRARRGKEDATRLAERTGKTEAKRPCGTLVWLHGASVGEVGITLNLMRAMTDARPDLQFLLTSGTLTSAELVMKGLGANARHQYLPLDTPQAVHRFLEHWHPDLGVFVESELWPNLILGARKKGIKLALVNARLNAASLQRWQGVPMSAARILDAFDWVGAADGGTMHSLQSFTKNTITNAGNLKHAAPAPTVDENTLALFKAAFGKRKIWLALSTHKQEEEVVLAAHRRIVERHPDAALILVPRHPERGARLAALCENVGQAHTLHSHGIMPNQNTRVYIGDSIGEMGLWLRLGAPAFIGGSLFSTMTGHTPLEAAKLSVPVLTGPFRASFYSIYKDLIVARGALEAGTATTIAQAVLEFFDSPQHEKTTRDAVLACAQNNATQPMKTTLAALLPLIGGAS